MTNEEKIIKIVKNYLSRIYSEFSKVGAVGIPNEAFFAIQGLLDLYNKEKEKNKELESDNYECNNIIRDYIEDWKLKTKIIDLMAEQLKTPINSKKDVVEYFENLAKESGEIDEDKSN